MAEFMETREGTAVQAGAAPIGILAEPGLRGRGMQGEMAVQPTRWPRIMVEAEEAEPGEPVPLAEQPMEGMGGRA